MVDVAPSTDNGSYFFHYLFLSRCGDNNVRDFSSSIHTWLFNLKMDLKEFLYENKISESVINKLLGKYNFHIKSYVS